MSEKILQFPGAEPVPGCPVEIARAPFGFCHHETITLDEHDRSVHCAKCGKAFEPFSFLLHEAQLIRAAWTTHASMKARIEEKSKELLQVGRELERAKAQLKRARDKLGTVAVRGGE